MPLLFLVFLIPLGLFITLFVFVVVKILSGSGRTRGHGPLRPGSGFVSGPMSSGDADPTGGSWLPWMAAESIRQGDDSPEPPALPGAGGVSPADTAMPPSQDSFSGGMWGDSVGGGSYDGGSSGGFDSGGASDGGGGGGGGGGGD